jgi:hypothetical protein
MNQTTEQSTFLGLPNQEWDSLTRGLMILFLSGALTYLTPTVTHLVSINIPTLYDPFVMSFWAYLVNYFRKLANT